jgi:uncharacterized membrane protein HdeD (DUF308 family)
VRAASHGGWGWQLALGAILFAIGASSVAFPKLGDLIWPVTILVLGIIVLARAMRPRA